MLPKHQGFEFEAGDNAADKTLRFETRFVRRLLENRMQPVALVHDAPSPHRVITTNGRGHLTLKRAGEQPTTISRAICGPEPPRRDHRRLVSIVKPQSGSDFHVRVFHTALISEGS